MLLSHTNMVGEFEFRFHSILVQRFSSYFYILFSFRCSSFSFHFIRNLLIFMFSDIRTIRSLGCQCWALGMHDGFVSLRLSRTPQFSRFSRACVPSLQFAPPFPSSLGNATTSVSLAFPVSLARASYWPGPGSVLLSLRFAPGYPRTDSPAASRRQGLPRGRRGGRVEEETRGDRRDGEDRSDAQVPRYTFSFHLPGALSETEKERKRQRIQGSGKILAIPPRSVGFFIRFARVGIRDICNFTSTPVKERAATWE